MLFQLDNPDIKGKMKWVHGYILNNAMARIK